MKSGMRTSATLLLCAAFLLPEGVHAAGVIKIGYDGTGQADITNGATGVSNTYDLGRGASAAVEGQWAVNENVDLGVGLGIQSYRQLTNYPVAGAFRFAPIYAKLQAHPEPRIGHLQPYLNLEAGYALFRADSALTGNGFYSHRDGTHLGIGGGLLFGKSGVFLEVMATRDTGGLDRNGVHVLDVTYNKTTVALGIKF